MASSPVLVLAAMVLCLLGGGAEAMGMTRTQVGATHRRAVSAGAARGRVASRATGRRATHTARAAAPARGGRAVGRASRQASSRTVVVVRGRGRHGRGARVVTVSRRARYSERFYASSFADVDNLTQGDVTAGEDPIVRAAAIEALGNMNGTALAIDPATGRILAMVNQKLALSHGAEPCSTIKLTVALAALQEGIVTKDTPVALGGGYRLTLTEALAHSNNLYFETLGRALGFERVKHYANQLGLGELAGYNIQGEQLGTYPDQELPRALGGVGRMCSFGESVSMTPLQLGAIVTAIANGGTLYYLQHPQTAGELVSFEPRVKRTLDIGKLIPEMKVGMQAATQYGTARSLRANFNEFPVMGKTGTCSNNGTRFGWFGSYADTPNGRIVTVIFLEGGRPTFGPKAAELTGQFYRALYDKSYFTPKNGTPAVAGTLASK
ncbi:penicillin-binding transpeptidase domain-containing protein [Granulicella sp. WH15]|uniref:penicillin-binding transpeptidase domain-containing protein n=1 Tax=Granulicella sp. WH15 TaxID=2602070 RepID=UPI002103E564|nr:penicillin-binding transpeptidase domain-containing protein [Granulicella sp. WH15]